MEAVRTPETNRCMTSKDPNVYDLFVCQTELGNGQPVTIAAWKPDAIDIFRINQGELIYTMFWGHGLPPQDIQAGSMFKTDFHELDKLQARRYQLTSRIRAREAQDLFAFDFKKELQDLDKKVEEIILDMTRDSELPLRANVLMLEAKLENETMLRVHFEEAHKTATGNANTLFDQNGKLSQLLRRVHQQGGNLSPELLTDLGATIQDFKIDESIEDENLFETIRKLQALVQDKNEAILLQQEVIDNFKEQAAYQLEQKQVYAKGLAIIADSHKKRGEALRLLLQKVPVNSLNDAEFEQVGAALGDDDVFDLLLADKDDKEEGETEDDEPFKVV